MANQVDCKKMEGLNVMLWTYWQSLFVSTYRKLHDAEMPRAKILETCCVVFDGSEFGSQLEDVRYAVVERNEGLSSAIASRTKCDYVLPTCSRSEMITA